MEKHVAVIFCEEFLFLDTFRAFLKNKAWKRGGGTVGPSPYEIGLIYFDFS
jgi:hypothetical protein